MTAGSVLEINFYGTQFNGVLPTNIGQLSQLKILNFGSTLLSGTIPPSIGQLSQLVSIDLTFSSIGGTIPSTIGELSVLNYLSLFSTQLSGSIPSELGQKLQLSYLYLSDTQISGTIPPNFAQLPQIHSLYLSNTQVFGPIPNIGYIASLQVLDLASTGVYGCLLTQQVPKKVFDYCDLTTLAYPCNCIMPYSCLREGCNDTSYQIAAQQIITSTITGTISLLSNKVVVPQSVVVSLGASLVFQTCTAQFGSDLTNYGTVSLLDNAVVTVAGNIVLTATSVFTVNAEQPTPIVGTTCVYLNGRLQIQQPVQNTDVSVFQTNCLKGAFAEVVVLGNPNCVPTQIYEQNMYSISFTTTTCDIGVPWWGWVFIVLGLIIVILVGGVLVVRRLRRSESDSFESFDLDTYRGASIAALSTN